jgi:hypothetical protein
MDLPFRNLAAHGLLLAASLLGACQDAAGTEPAFDAGTAPALSGSGSNTGGGAADAGAAIPSAPGIFPGDGGITQPGLPSNPSGTRDAAVPDTATAGDAGAQTDAGGTGTTGMSGLPSATDLKKAGPFTPTSTPGPSGYVLFYPKELGKEGFKHPILSWGPGAAEDAGMFTTLLNHLASHGYAVISFDGTPQGPELTKGIDWMVAENARTDGPFFQKLNIDKIAAGGHSAGSLATFAVGADKRLTTTLHISGGTFDPHTDIKNLHAPALFVCGEPAVDGLIVGDVARENCDLDFKNATVPVFYGVTKGASHMTPTEIGDATLRSYQMAAIAGWLRWQLSSDAGAKSMFAGSGCALCTDTNWTVQQKNLN